MKRTIDLSAIEDTLDSIDEIICENRDVSEEIFHMSNEIEKLQNLAIKMIDLKVLTNQVDDLCEVKDIKNMMEEYNNISLVTWMNMEKMIITLDKVINKLKNTKKENVMKNDLKKKINGIVKEMSEENYDKWIRYLYEGNHYLFDDYPTERQLSILNDFKVKNTEFKLM